MLAAVAHELKNALAPLGMTLQLIERQVKSGQPIVAEDLAFSRAQVRLLSGLVDDLLDQARVDLAALPFRPDARRRARGGRRCRRRLFAARTRRRCSPTCPTRR